MRSLLTITLVFLLAAFSPGQTLNNDGLYVNAEGSLYSGMAVMKQNNSKVEITIKNGQAEGPAFYYYPSGKLMETGSFLAGQKNDKWVRYNEKGAIMSLAFFTAGKKTGAWHVYDDNGNLRFEMNYTNGEKSGIWKNWDGEGNLVTTRDFSKVN